MDIDKPLATEEFLRQRVELQSDIEIRVRTNQRRALVSLVVFGVTLAILIKTHPLWSHWFQASTAGSVVAGAILLIVEVLLLGGCVDETKVDDAKRKLAKLESDNGRLIDSEIEDLAEMIRQHPEIKAVVKEWRGENLDVQCRQFRQLRLYANHLRTERLHNELNEALEG